MAIPRLFVPDELKPGARGVLDAHQTRQVRSVLRLSAGSQLTLLDGNGIESCARIVAVSQSGASFEVLTVATPDREPSLRLTVGLAVLKGDRFEFAIQKLTELGVTRIVPLLTERCVVSFDDARAWQKRSERYERIAREAAEQSERVRLPEIAEPTALTGFLHQQPVIALIERDSTVPIAGCTRQREMAIAIGPEGGWTQAEQDLIAREASGMASLGRLILRAETAAIIAAGTLIQLSWTEQPMEHLGGNRS